MLYVIVYPLGYRQTIVYTSQAYCIPRICMLTTASIDPTSIGEIPKASGIGFRGCTSFLHFGRKNNPSLHRRKFMDMACSISSCFSFQSRLRCSNYHRIRSVHPSRNAAQPRLRTFATMKMNGHAVQPAQTLRRDPDGFLNRSVKDLFSLDGRTVVITGGARGIGLAFAFAVAESGGHVAVLDVSEEPHPHFNELPKRFPKQKFKTYKLVCLFCNGPSAS